MNKYEVTVYYEGSNTYYVEAHTEQEAKQEAEGRFQNGLASENSMLDYEKVTDIGITDELDNQEN